MAHDFGICNKRKKNYTFFFGYADALMYRAFGEQRPNIFSGNGDKREKTKAEAEKALDYAIREFDRMGYPDPTRMDDIKQFRKEMLSDPDNDTYEVFFH
jgi:hypothetical protein